MTSGLLFVPSSQARQQEITLENIGGEKEARNCREGPRKKSEGSQEIGGLWQHQK